MKFLVYPIITYNAIYRIKSPPELVPQIVGEMKRKFKVSSHRYADANKPHD